jgi:PAS domain-containing protein
MDADRAAASPQEIAALVAGSPFAERMACGAPTLVFAGPSPRLLYASPAALDLFGAASLPELEALIAAASPGARRLVGLVQAGAGGPPRVESLRFYVDRRPLPLTLLCGRIGDLLVVSTPPGPDEIAAPTLARAAREPAPPPPRRFLWSLDRAERFGAVDPGLAAAFGPLAPQPGEPLATFRARVGFDRDGQFAQILAARRTFAVLPLAWPEIAGARARMALMSGAPALDRDRNFSGWRGFGLFSDEATGAPASERSADIVVLRTLAPPPANVVPIRPGAMSQLAATPEPPRGAQDGRETGGQDNVELTNHERDAFREIARALGARLPGGRDHDGAEAPRDLIDLAPASAAAAPERNAATLIDRLPIGAMVLRGGEPLYLNRTLLELAGYRDLAEFRAADGLSHLFRGRDAQTLAESNEGGPIPLIAAGGELIAVDARAEPIEWDGAPATLLSLRRSRETEFQERLRAADRETRDLKALLDSAADGMLTLDETGRVLAMSRGAEALFGYDAKEVAGESFLILFAPQSQSDAT